MATIFIVFLGIYFLIGFLFSLWFVQKGAAKMDKLATNANWKLKLLWLPGAAALWPFLLKKSS
ncbi:MAG: hypothetical protein R2830_08065 [Saprospiraceae bacterium]|nr:hypothetical protein [Saprospiraceae bacterium]